MAKVLKTFVFKGDDEPFVMEMPKYRMPSLKLIWHTVYGQAKSYLKKAGTFILAASILIWFASNYPKNHELEAQYETKIEQALNDDAKSQLNNELSLALLEQSYLGEIGHASEPFFAPLGFDWRLTAALIFAFLAKEIAVEGLGIILAVESEVAIQASLVSLVSPATAIAFMIFVPPSLYNASSELVVVVLFRILIYRYLIIL